MLVQAGYGLAVSPMTASFSDTVSALAALLWPLIVLAVVVFLLPELRRVVASRSFTVEVAGMKIDVRDASEQLAKQVADLRRELEEMQRRDGLRDSAAEPVVEEVESPVARGEPDIRPPRAPRFRLLWADEKPENNAFEIKALSDEGWDVVNVRSTADAVDRLEAEPGGFDVVISDMGRREGLRFRRDAGLELLDRVRRLDAAMPVVLYTSATVAAQRRAEALERGAVSITASSVELHQHVRGAVLNTFAARMGKALEAGGVRSLQWASMGVYPLVTGELDGRRVGAVAVLLTPAESPTELEPPAGALRAHHRTLNLTDGVLVVPHPVPDARRFPEGHPPVAVASLGELPGLLASWRDQDGGP
jgi:CheY-like chemotaxis protein